MKWILLTRLNSLKKMGQKIIFMKHIFLNLLYKPKFPRYIFFGNCAYVVYWKR